MRRSGRSNGWIRKTSGSKLGERAVRASVHGLRGSNVQDGQPRHVTWMIQRQPMRDTATTIVTSEMKAFEAKRPHYAHLIKSHGAFRVIDVVGAAFDFAGCTVPPQVCCNDGETLGQPGSDLVPAEVGLRKSMQQQQRRTNPPIRA